MKKIYTKSRNFFTKENQKSASSNKMVGYFERVSETNMLEGWAIDKDNLADFVTVHVFIDNVLLTSAIADNYREDLISANVKEDGMAGFSIPLVLNEKNKSLFKVGAKIDVAFDDKNQFPLEGSGKILKALPSLNRIKGYFEGVSERGTFEGWAVDEDNLTDFVKVYLFVDEELLASATADSYRGDLAGAKVKVDGRAAFSITVELSKANLALLKPDVKIDVALDKQNQQQLPGSGHLLNKDEINTILSTGFSHTVPLMIQVDSVIGLVAACKDLDNQQTTNELQELDQSDEQINFLAKCKHASFMVVRIAHQLYNLECYEQLLEFLSHINNPHVLKFCQLECALLRVIVLTDNELLNEHIIELLDTAFYERSNDDVAKQQSVYFAVYMDAVILAFYALLQSKATHLLKPDTTFPLLGKLAYVLSFWQYRLNANPHLSLNFLSLLQTFSPELLKKAESQNHLAHLRRELGDNLNALAHCLNAIRQDTDYWWAYHEAAIILGVLSSNQRALAKNNLLIIEDYFYRAFVLNPYQSKSLREFEQVLAQYFSSSYSLTWQLAESGFVDDALAERDQDLQLLIQIMSRIYAGKFHSLNFIEKNKKNQPTLSANKVVFVGSRGLFQCYYYRIQQKLEQAEQIDLITDYLDITELNQRNWQRMLMNVAVLYVCRIPATVNEIKLLCYAKGLGITIVYDIDDLIFDATAFPADLETYAGTIDEKTHLHLTMDNPFFLNALKLADICVASTQPLAQEIAKQVRADVVIKVHPNVLPYDLYDLAKVYKPVLSKMNQNSVMIVYGSATKAHKQSFYEVFLPAVLTVLKKNSKVQLSLIGYFDDIPLQFNKQITVLEPTSDFMGYINLLKKADISVAILEQSRLTDTKSEIKWLEAAAFEIPSIVTPTQAYRDVLTEDENVLFAATQAEWEAQLLRLIENAELRKSIGKAAKKLAFDKFSPQIGEQILNETVAQFISNKTIVKKAKKRVLLVNVYFYPQSVGGATRVFENQVRGLIERYPDEYEVFVLTSEADSDIGKPYHVEQYWFENVLVTKLNVPPRNWVDYEDKQIYDFCLEFFEEYHFDIIHFHSVQVLTASVVSAAAKLKIPHIITIHDAWWISIFQFLVNPKGELVDHTSPLSGLSKEDLKQVNWIINRWRELQNLLIKANLVVAVSEKFAKLYQEAGIHHVGVHENYVEPFAHLESRHQISDKIVLGFIGGMSTHKGYDLLKMALEKGHFPNMQLRVVNHGLHSGEVHYSKWGDTVVEFRAKAKQSEVAKLYAQFDVLIAPSIWPESYGLVTREALQAGLWVIASDRGAIGDCIVEGVNGNIVNVEDYLGLMKALEALPEQLKKQDSNENQELLAAEVVGETAQSHLQKLVSMYQSVLGKDS